MDIVLRTWKRHAYHRHAGNVTVGKHENPKNMDILRFSRGTYCLMEYIRAHGCQAFLAVGQTSLAIAPNSFVFLFTVKSSL